MLELRRIETLIEVAERQSFSAAADALSFTQSAISQQIATLERQAGIKLLNRKPVSLTEAGRLLVGRAGQAIVQLQAAETEIESLRGLRDGSLRLATFASAAATLMPAAIGEFSRRFPGVSVSLVQSDVAESENRLRSGELDLALTFDYSLSPAPRDEMLARTLLLEEPVYLVMGPGHRLARATSVRLHDLANDPWVAAAESGIDLRLLADSADGPGFDPKVTLEGGDFDTVLGLVAVGVGVAVVPRLALRGARQVLVRPIEGLALTRCVYATSLATNYLPPTVQAMVPILRSTVAAAGASSAMRIAA
jgi:DNA-binding transcriptional LysR family regulator